MQQYWDDIGNVEPAVGTNYDKTAYNIYVRAEFRTLKQRNHDPIRTTIAALKSYLTTGILLPLLKPASDD